jgi:hypothetical protein
MKQEIPLRKGTSLCKANLHKQNNRCLYDLKMSGTYGAGEISNLLLDDWGQISDGTET